MNNILDDLFLKIKNDIFILVQQKNINLDELSFELGISRNEFINNFGKRIDDFSFYLETLSILEHCEG